MNIKRRLVRLESAAQTGKEPPHYLVTAGPVCVIDRRLRVIVPEKRPAA